MDFIINNPGLQQISEEILLSLEQTDLLKCQKVNQSWKNILTNPLFWAKKCVKSGSMPEKHFKIWIKLIQALDDEENKENLTAYLMKRVCLKRVELDVTPIHYAVKNGCTTIVTDSKIMEVLAQMTDNPNAPYPHDGWTPIQMAAQRGYSKIIEVLAPLTDNPNAPDPRGWTPIQRAAYNGYSKIIEVLAPMTDNPNAPDPRGWTPIQRAALFGTSKIVEVLAPMTDNPNAPDPCGWTPIQRAAEGRYSKILEVLAPMADRTTVSVAPSSGKFSKLFQLLPLLYKY